MEKEKSRLKRLLAYAELDKAMLREAALEDFEPGEPTLHGGLFAEFAGGERELVPVS